MPKVQLASFHNQLLQNLIKKDVHIFVHDRWKTSFLKHLCLQSETKRQFGWSKRACSLVWRWAWTHTHTLTVTHKHRAALQKLQSRSILKCTHLLGADVIPLKTNEFNSNHVYYIAQQVLCKNDIFKMDSSKTWLAPVKLRSAMKLRAISLTKPFCF